MKLYEEHRDARDRFEILAFHDATVKTLAEMDAKLTRTVAEVWKGKPLPFPILLDATGKTIRELEIRAFPTLVLIDPKGRVVEGGDEKMLAKKLTDGD